MQVDQSVCLYWAESRRMAACQLDGPFGDVQPSPSYLCVLDRADNENSSENTECFQLGGPVLRSLCQVVGP